jgi:hypothetical protein
LNGDGRPDIAVTTELPSQLVIFQNLSTPGTLSASSLAAPVVLASGWNPGGVTIADLNGDGRPDVFFCTEYDQNIWVYQNSVPFGTPAVAPGISTQPTNLTVTVNGMAVFYVAATGTPPLSYQWNFNGTNIAGATNATLTINNVQLSDSGSTFSCLVSNAYGTATSTNVLLKVIDTVANGLCNGAILITDASYTNTQSTLNADAPGNPVLDCVSGFGHAVWYEFTAPVAGRLLVDTFGSDYDTGLGLFTGSCDSLTQVGCNDDAGGGVTSQVILPTMAGTTYISSPAVTIPTRATWCCI